MSIKEESKLGKIAFEALQDLLGCIRKTPRVIVPPAPGFDSGVHDLGNGMCMVIATDPCIGVPEGWFGWFLINYSASDVAVFGAKPQYCTVNLLGPPGTKVEVFKKIMQQACDAANELDITIITGHTGTYHGLSIIMGTCTAYGMIERERLITPAGVKPGDYLLCIKPIGLEILTNFALTHQNLANKLFGAEQARYLAEQVKMQTCVDEALLLAETGAVSAMHDATEGGLVAALNEMADASNVGFRIDFTKLPITRELQTLAEHFQLTREQIMSMSSTGTLLAAISPRKKDEIIEKLLKRGLNAKVIGVFFEDKERIIKHDDEEMEFPRRIDDPYALIIGS